MSTTWRTMILSAGPSSVCVYVSVVQVLCVCVTVRSQSRCVCVSVVQCGDMLCSAGVECRLHGGQWPRLLVPVLCVCMLVWSQFCVCVCQCGPSRGMCVCQCGAV